MTERRRKIGEVYKRFVACKEVSPSHILFSTKSISKLQERSTMATAKQVRPIRQTKLREKNVNLVSICRKFVFINSSVAKDKISWKRNMTRISQTAKSTLFSNKLKKRMTRSRKKDNKTRGRRQLRIGKRIYLPIH